VSEHIFLTAIKPVDSHRSELGSWLHFASNDRLLKLVGLVTAAWLCNSSMDHVLN